MRISDWSSDVCSSDLHRLHAAGLADHQFVGEEDRERFVAHDIARAPHRMAQPQRLLLADIGARAGLEPRRLQHLERFAALLHHRLQLEGDVEMILDRGLVRSEEHTSELPSLMRISYA